MPAPPFRRIARHLLFLASATAVFAPAPAQAVSSGCAEVNGGAWNQSLQSFSIGATLTGFDDGDRLDFTVRGNGQLVLLASSGGSFLDVLVVNTPGSGSFKVKPPYTTFRTLNDAVSGPLNITATCTPAPTPPTPLPNPTDASHSQAVTRAFLAARINGILLNDPSATSLLNRSNSTAPPFATAMATSPWDIWVEGRYSAFNDDTAHLDRSGFVGVLYFGGDYRIAENIIVGALAQFDWAKDDSDVFTSKVDGNGWMIGPYMSARIHDNVYFDLRAAWGRSSNSLTHTNTETASDFDTTRWLVKGTLTGNWLYDAWRITPSAELAYITESQDAFTNSAGTFVPGQNVSLGRLQFGPEVGYSFGHTANTFIEPFAAIKGVWDFDNPDVAIIDGYVVGPGAFWGRLQSGLNVVTSSGTYVRGLASWDGLGTAGYNGYTLQGTVNVPLD